MWYLLISSIVLFSISTIKYRAVCSINNIFTFMWTCTLVLNCLLANDLGVIEPSDDVFFYVTIAVIVFNVTYLMLINREENKIHYNFNDEIVISNKYIFLCISVVLLMPIIIENVAVLMSGNLGLIRTLYVERISTAGGVYVYLTMIIPFSIINCAMIISAIEVVYKKTYRYFFLTLFSMIAYTLAYGGRDHLKTMFIYLLVLMAFSDKKRFNKKIIFYVFLLVGVIVGITYSRGLEDKSFLEMVASYFLYQYSMLEYIIENPYSYGLNDSNSYGMLLLGPVATLPSMLLKIIFPEVNIPANEIGVYTQPFINIGTGDNFVLTNAHVTSIYYFLFDCGTSGVLLGPFIFSLLVCVIQKIKMKSKNIMWDYISLFLIVAVINSPIAYELCQPYVALMFPIMWLMMRKARK